LRLRLRLKFEVEAEVVFEVEVGVWCLSGLSVSRTALRAVLFLLAFSSGRVCC
jgi:hypothetical protein